MYPPANSYMQNTYAVCARMALCMRSRARAHHSTGKMASAKCVCANTWLRWYIYKLTHNRSYTLHSCECAKRQKRAKYMYSLMPLWFERRAPNVRITATTTIRATRTLCTDMNCWSAKTKTKTLKIYLLIFSIRQIYLLSSVWRLRQFLTNERWKQNKTKNEREKKNHRIRDERCNEPKQFICASYMRTIYDRAHDLTSIWQR